MDIIFVFECIIHSCNASVIEHLQLKADHLLTYLIMY